MLTDFAVASFMPYGPTSSLFSFCVMSVPCHSPSQVWTGLGYCIRYGEGYSCSGLVPCSSAAAAITGLKVDPGWYPAPPPMS